MPPKDSPKKPPLQVLRPPVSDSSLLYEPEDVVEGFKERELTGIDWTLLEKAALHHRELCYNEDIPVVTFSEALKNKIDKSILANFLNEQSSLTLEEHWELLLPITLWDNEKFANEEGRICFNNCNSITDNMIKIIQKAVRAGDREVLRKDIKMVNVLRVNDTQMTNLDPSISEFNKLVSLNLCGNFIQDMDATLLPSSLRSIELQANRIKLVAPFAEHLPTDLLYLGLARNFLNDESIEGFAQLPHYISVLDISDNDIYDLEELLDALVRLPNLMSLMAAGNPCSVCAAYARTTLMRLPRLRWLDSREILPSDRSGEQFEPHPDDLRAAYFNFTVFRVMSAPQPPKPEKGAITTFHVELELPLLDATRRTFLMFRRHESLIEMLPPPEDDESSTQEKQLSTSNSKMLDIEEASSHESDVYKVLTAKNSREVCHYTTFESNRVQWNKVMNFQEPTVKIFCPNLEALRNTFRTVVTVRLVYSLTTITKPGKVDKKSASSFKTPGEQRVVLATVRCALQRPDWSQPSQHFHWDNTMNTNDAIHWGDGDLSVLQYSQAPAKAVKGKAGDGDINSSRQQTPDNLTCHFGFGIDTLHT